MPKFWYKKEMSTSKHNEVDIFDLLCYILVRKGSEGMKNRLRIKNMTHIALGAVILTVCSWISIPTPLIPFTLQTFGIFLLVYLFGAKKAFASLTVYILLGLIGVPVFSSFRTGIAVLFGVTGGYVIGFLLSVGFCAAAGAIFSKNRCVRLLVSFASLLACYAVGSAWVVYVSGMNESFLQLLWGSIASFGVFDCIKIVFADTLSSYLKKIISI